MMKQTTEMLAAYDAQLRCHVPPNPPAGVVHEMFGPVLRVSGRAEGFVETLPDVGARGSALDALIAEHRDYFAARGEPMEWKTRAHDLPADLPDRLIAAGFVPEEPETVLAASVYVLLGEGDRPGLAGNALPEGVGIRRISELADFQLIADLQAAVWGTDQSSLARELFNEAAAAPDDVLVFVAEADGVVVSSARLELVPGTDFAGLWGGSTREGWRGRGIYRALVDIRARAAAARGVKYLQVDASADSAPILARLGFETLTATTPYIWSPPKSAAAVPG